MPIRLKTTLTCGLLLFGLFFCISCRNGDVPTKSMKEITICQYGDLLIYLPLYIAVDRGFFEEEGLKIKLVNSGGDEKTFATVSSGAAQFGVSDPTFTAIAREKGRRGVVVATIVGGAPYWGVTWKKDIKPAKSAKDLRDLRIATYQAPSTNYSLMAKTLKANKDDIGNAKIVEGAYGTLLAALKADRADVAMELEPIASMAVEQGATIVYSYPEMYGAFMLTGMYVLEDYRDKNLETVQSAVNGLEKAMIFAHKDFEGAVSVAKKRFPEVSEAVIRSAVDRMIKLKTLPEHVTMDREGWNNTINVRIELGDLSSKEEADKALDHTFAKKATASTP